MSVHWDSGGNRWVVRFRDSDGRQRTVTVNERNLRKYGELVPKRITERVAKKLEKAVLSRETAADGSVRSARRRKLLWLEVVARYLPPLRDQSGEDTWHDRPPQPLENEKTYSRNQLDRMAAARAEQERCVGLLVCLSSPPLGLTEARRSAPVIPLPLLLSHGVHLFDRPKPRVLRAKHIVPWLLLGLMRPR